MRKILKGTKLAIETVDELYVTDEQETDDTVVPDDVEVEDTTTTTTTSTENHDTCFKSIRDIYNAKQHSGCIKTSLDSLNVPTFILDRKNKI